MDDAKTTSKLSQACNECRAKKKKCDRASPRCSYCARNQLVCEYRKTRRPGLPVGYGTAMLLKIEKLDEKLDRQQYSSLREIRAVAELLLRVETQMLQIVRNGSILPGHPQNDYSNAMNVQGLSQHPNQNDNAVEHQREPLRVTNHLEHHVAQVETYPTLNKQATWPLPSEQVTSVIIAQFFKKVYPGFRVIHPSTKDLLVAEYARRWEIGGDATDVPPNILGVILCALRFSQGMLLAQEIHRCREFCRSTIVAKCIAVTLVEQLQAMALLAYDLYGDSNNPQTWSYISLMANGVMHLGLCREPILDHNSKQQTEMKGLQSDLKLTSGEIEKPRKKAKTTRLLSISTSVGPHGAFDDECQKNIFWETFMLDRLLSVSNSSPFKILDSEIDRLLPSNDKTWDLLAENVQGKPLNGGARINEKLHHFGSVDLAGLLAQVVDKLGNIHTFLRESFDVNNVKEVLAWQMRFSEIDNDFAKWKGNLTSHYQQFLDNQTVSFARQVNVKDVLLFTMYHMAVIRLNSAVGYHNFDSKYFLLSSTARSKCLQSAESIATFTKNVPVLLGHLEGDVHSACGPYYGFALWVAARLLFVDSIKSGEEFLPGLDLLILVLSQVGHLWRSSLRYNEILTFLRNEELENRAKGFRALVEGTTSLDPEGKNLQVHSKSAQVFADMRFNAYSLDVLLSEKIEQFKKDYGEISTHSPTDFSNFFSWFKIPTGQMPSPAPMPLEREW